MSARPRRLLLLFGRRSPERGLKLDLRWLIFLEMRVRAYLTLLTLLCGFFLHSLRVQLSRLGHSRLDNFEILSVLSQSGRIVLQREGDRVNPTCGVTRFSEYHSTGSSQCR